MLRSEQRVLIGGSEQGVGVRGDGFGGGDVHHLLAGGILLLLLLFFGLSQQLLPRRSDSGRDGLGLVSGGVESNRSGG